MMVRSAFLTAAAVAAMAASAQATFVAYNDIGGTSTGGATSITAPTGNSNAESRPNSGFLKNYATNTNTSVTLAISTSPGATDAQWDSGTSNGAMSAAGTDAYNIFDGKINPLGYLWYNDTTTSGVRLTLSGCDPTATYSVTLFGNRANAAYTDRYTVSTIGGAETFTNTSSAGATLSTISMANDTTAVITGANSAGRVAQYSAIAAGSDGSFYVDVHGLVEGTNTHKWYLNAVQVTETSVPEPASLSLLMVGGLLLGRRRA